MKGGSKHVSPFIKGGLRGICAAFVLFIAATSLFASLYEEEIRISGEIQSQIQKELENVLGKNRVACLVHLELTLEPDLKDAIKNSVMASRGRRQESSTPEESKGKTEFTWKGETSGTGSYILPGFPAKKKAEQQSSQQGDRSRAFVEEPRQSFRPETSLVLAAGTTIKRIAVKISLDKNLPENSEEIVRNIVSGYLELKPERGDSLVIDKVDLPQPWKGFLRDPDLLSRFILKAITAFAALAVTLLIVFGVLSFAKTLRRTSERIAGAISSGLSQKNVGMDIKYKHLGGKSSPGAPSGISGSGLLDEGEEFAPSLGSSEGSGENGQTEDSRERSLPLGKQEQKFRIEVGLDQVAKLYHLLHREHPDNISLVLPHLDADVRKAFLSLLPKETAAEVLSSLSNVRFLDPDDILKLKTEMERRVRGTVGGVEQVVDLIQNADLKTKKDLLGLLTERNPSLAAEVRKSVLLFEDLLLLSDSDMSVLLSPVKSDELVTALTNAPSEIAQKIKSGLSRKTAAVLQEMMSFRSKVSEDKIAAAQDKILSLLSEMIKDGKINNPIVHKKEEGQKLMEETKPGEESNLLQGQEA